MTMKHCLLLLTAAAVVLSSCGKKPPETGVEQPPPPEITTFTDERDGQTYRAVKIGEQVWMAENLNYQTEKSVCYEDSAAYCEKYGRLYTWDDMFKACPAGWHFPSDKEWTALVDFAGGNETAGTKLKSTSGWKDDGNGTDEYGFSALPGGFGYYGDGSFHNAGEYGNWCGATEGDADDIWYRRMYYDSEGVDRDNNHGKAPLFAVRCMRDE